jgi:hypothetical protein
MRIRIALATAVAVILIPVVFLLTIFSGSPSASTPAAARHEAIGQHRATRPAVKAQQAKLAAFYQAVQNSQLAAFYQAVQNSQLAAFYQAINNQQLAAFYQAINNQQVAAWYNAVHNAQVAAWYNAVHNSQVAAWYNAVNNSQRATAAAPAPAPAPAPATGGGSASGPWACIAQYESGGNWAADTGNGYYGGLQFSMSTWLAYGGTGNPANASVAEQEAVANRVLAAQGWGAWPNTSRMCGL